MTAALKKRSLTLSGAFLRGTVVCGLFFRFFVKKIGKRI